MKKTILICMFCAMNIFCHAQIDNLLASSNQQFIEEALKDAFLVIRQNYQIQDSTGAVFGWNNANQFGSTLSLGVKIKNGYVFGEKVMSPWNYDSRFASYRNIYKPILSKTEYRSINNKVFKTIEFRDTLCHKITNINFYENIDTVFDNQGLEINNTLGEIKGWIVLLVSPNDATLNDSTNISLVIYKEDITIVDTLYKYKIKKAATKKHILGGIYISANQTTIGNVSFKMVGIIDFADNEWNMYRITNNVSNAQGVITPISNTEQNQGIQLSNDTLQNVQNEENNVQINTENQDIQSLNDTLQNVQNEEKKFRPFKRIKSNNR